MTGVTPEVNCDFCERKLSPGMVAVRLQFGTVATCEYVTLSKNPELSGSGTGRTWHPAKVKSFVCCWKCLPIKFRRLVVVAEVEAKA